MINSKYILPVTEKCNIYTVQIHNCPGNSLEMYLMYLMDVAPLFFTL